jgi:hypothetical protein
MIKISLAALALAGCAWVPPAKDSLKITSVVQGLMRNEYGTWRVYEPGGTFKYQANGDCTVAGRKSTCLWYGIEFDYTTQSDSTTITCVAHTNAPTTVVTYKEVEAKDTQEFHFKITLSGQSGHTSRPGYVESFEFEPGDTEGIREQVECSHAGTVVLSYAFNLQ